MALSKAVKQFLWFTTALDDLRLGGTPSSILCENMSTIDISENHRIFELSKHIDVHYHRIRELVQSKTIILMHVPTAENLADMCTKALTGDTLRRLRSLTMGTN